MTNKTKQLLHTPEGVFDHYGNDCREYEEVSSRVRSSLHRFGYQDIKTPTFEFFDVFSREIGTKPSRELYKFTDKEGNTLVLRPDFTPSVARCAAKYFMDVDDPLRFCYEGSVFANTSSLQGKRKESIQMGAECINDASAEIDAELIALLIDALRSCGLNQIQIAVGNVQYFRGLCEAACLDEETEMDLRAFISSKNYFAAEKLLKEHQVSADFEKKFLKIASPAGSKEDLKELEQDAPNETSKQAIMRLMEVYQILTLYGVESFVSFDLSILSKYRYYTGILFRGYTYGVGEHIAAGGRYDSLLSQFGKQSPAIGFMIELDTLVEAMRAQKIMPDEQKGTEVIYYSDQRDFKEKLPYVQALRKEGHRVVFEKKTDCVEGKTDER